MNSAYSDFYLAFARATAYYYASWREYRVDA